eukprot:5725801-Amphidinium_carterae.1
MQQCAQQSASELKEETTRRFAEIDEWKERLRNSIESMQLKARSLESTICRIDAADSQRSESRVGCVLTARDQILIKDCSLRIRGRDRYKQVRATNFVCFVSKGIELTKECRRASVGH